MRTRSYAQVPKMDKFERKSLVRAWAYLMKEMFEGPASKGGIFLDPETGLFETLEKINSFEASLVIEGTSIAAHTEHLRFYLEVLCGYMNGVARIVDWSVGWKKTEVTEKEWSVLRTKLAETYASARDSVDRVAVWDVDAISMGMALIAHSAYHLSAIRQIAKHL